MKNTILDFIDKFNTFPGAVEMFTQGMCYWFAHILTAQFGGEICYAPEIGHFVARIDGNCYDINGDAAAHCKYVKLFEWGYLQELDPHWAANIKRDCIDKSDYYPEV
jgi:hypothetical protein